MAAQRQYMEPLQVFFCYSHKDKNLRDELEKHLSLLKHEGLISAWHDRKISPGNEFDEEIDKKLLSVQVVLLLISPDFMASGYCYKDEMAKALDRHETHAARVIPIILRPTDWKTAPFAKLLVLPRDGEPVTSNKWDSQDQAFLDVANGIRYAITGDTENLALPSGDSLENSMLILLHLCKDRGLPKEVISAALARSTAEIERETKGLFENGLLAETDKGMWVFTGERSPTASSNQELLFAKTLDELLSFIRSHQKHSNMDDQAKNAIELSRRCKASYPNSVAKLFGFVDKLVKGFGDKHLVLEVANLSIEAARSSPNRTADVVKGEAVALICGRSWVYQRTDQLSDAVAAGEASFELGEHIPWERNSAFCKKCIGRIYRMQAEKELEAYKPSRQEVVNLLDKSTESLTEAIQRFSQLEEFGPDDPEVGDCYSLLGRTFLVSENPTEADNAVKKAFKLIPESSDKDYLDLLILAGDLQSRNGAGEAADSFYNSALRINSENAEITEMRARAYLARGQNRAMMKPPHQADKDISKAAGIFLSLGEIDKSNHALWEQRRIQNQIPIEAVPLLEQEGYTTRIVALDMYSKQQTSQRRRRNVIGQRAALSPEQWKQIVKKARSLAIQKDPKW